MTHRAEQQLIVPNALDRGELLMAEAANLLGLSTRQVRRLRRAYQRHGHPTAEACARSSMEAHTGGKDETKSLRSGEGKITERLSGQNH